jgi:hypothetical protein
VNGLVVFPWHQLPVDAVLPSTRRRVHGPSSSRQARNHALRLPPTPSAALCACPGENRDERFAPMTACDQPGRHVLVGCAGATVSVGIPTLTICARRQLTPATAVSASLAPTQEPVAVAYGPVRPSSPAPAGARLRTCGDGRDNGAPVQWGSSRLENDGGLAARALASTSSDRGDTIAFWYTGTGGTPACPVLRELTGRTPGRSRNRSSPATPDALVSRSLPLRGFGRFQTLRAHQLATRACGSFRLRRTDCGSMSPGAPEAGAT